MNMFKVLVKTQFARNIFSLTSSSIIAQVINFFLTMVLTRIYSPSDFGLLTIFFTVTSLVGVFCTCKYDVAIVVSKTREDGISLVRLSMFISIIFSLFAFLVIVIFKPFIKGYLEHPEIINWFYYLPVTLFFTAASQILWMWNVREKKFKDLSTLRIIETSSNGGFSIVLKWLGAIGLMFGTMTSQVVSSLFLGIRVIMRDKFNPFLFKKNDLKQSAKAYSEFPKFNILQGFADMLLISAIVLVGSRYFSVYVMGLYALCMRVLQLPMGLIIRPIAHVFFAEASEKYRKGEDFYKLTRQTIFRTALFASVVPISLLIAGPFLFSLVFGAQWRESGDLCTNTFLLDLPRFHKSASSPDTSYSR